MACFGVWRNGSGCMRPSQKGTDMSVQWGMEQRRWETALWWLSETGDLQEMRHDTTFFQSRYKPANNAKDAGGSSHLCFVLPGLGTKWWQMLVHKNSLNWRSEVKYYWNQSLKPMTSFNDMYLSNTTWSTFLPFQAHLKEKWFFCHFWMCF